MNEDLSRAFLKLTQIFSGYTHQDKAALGGGSLIVRLKWKRVLQRFVGVVGVEMEGGRKGLQTSKKIEITR